MKTGIINLFFILFSISAFGQKITEKEARDFVTKSIESQIGYKKAVKGYYDALSKNLVIWGNNTWKKLPVEYKFDKDSYNDDGSYFYEDSIDVTIHDVYLMCNNASLMGTIKFYIAGVNTTYRNFTCIITREGSELKYIRWVHADNTDLAANFLWPSTKIDGGLAAYNKMREAMFLFNNDLAKKISDSLVAQDPKWATAHLGQLGYYFWKGDKINLTKSYNEAMSKLKGASIAERHVISIFNPYNDKVTRRYHLDQALIYASDDPMIRCWNAYWQEDVTKAIEILVTAWERFPENAGVNAMLAYKYMDDGQMDKAKQHVEIFLRVYPNSANAYDTAGDYYLETGDKAKAKEMFLKAYSLDNLFTASKAKADKL